VYNNFKYCSQKCLDWYLNENKDATLGYQEKASLAEENKQPPSKPILLQLEEKSAFLRALIPSELCGVFLLHLVFVDTENDGKNV
jgi:hypothetical protein